MLLLSALLRLFYHILRLGVRVAGSVEVGRPHRKRPKAEDADEWETLPYRFNDIDWYAPASRAGGRDAVAKPPQPINTAAGVPPGSPEAGPQRPE